MPDVTTAASRPAASRLRLRGLALRGVAAAAALTLAAPLALAQSVVVQGNRRTEAATIQSYISAANGDLAVARRELLASGLFSSVNIARRGGTIVVSVTENNVVNRVVFQGARKIKSDVLVGELQTKARGPYDPERVEADRQRIIDIYKRSGRSLATVTPRIVDLPNGRVDVVFDVNEGDKTGVVAINFVGNERVSSGRLRSVMNTTETNFLSWLKTSDVYDPDRLAADQELIRRHYLKNGYADFRIVNSSAEFDASRNGYVITIAVEEGQQYRVGAVDVDSRLRDVDSGRLRGLVRTSPGEVYNAEAVERSLTAITTDVASRGYAFSQVRPQGVRDPATGTINLLYVVEEGPRVYIERINIRGNTRTRDYVVLREFDVGEGDAYNKVLMDRAERRLNALGFFKKVRITNEPGSSPDRVVVNVDVEDQPTGSFSISGGYSTADGFIAEIAVAESNFMGRGQYVRVSATGGQRSQGAEFSFTEPYFLGYRLAAGFDLFYKNTEESTYQYYDSTVAGGTLRLGIPITEAFSVGVRYSLFQTRIKIPFVYQDGILSNGEASVGFKESIGTRTTSLVGYTLAYNVLDNPKDPRQGYYAEFRQDFAGVGGDARFIRSTGEARYYHDISDDFVGMLKVQAGNITGWGDDPLRITDQFNLGPSLVRGFAVGGIGPRDLNVDPRGNSLGGRNYVGGTAELQFPVFGLPREVGLKAALFADAGSLWDYGGIKSFDFNRNGIINCPGTAAFNATLAPECVNVLDRSGLRASVGASLLWNSPLGPIRFDFAQAVVKQNGDRTQFFRFSGGTRF